MITDFKNTDNIEDLDFEICSRAGIELLMDNKIGVIILAGGQGSRLGLDKPKGTLLLNGKSLFEIHANKINNLTNTLNVKIPLYIMTSCNTHTDTIDFFEKNNYFNLQKGDVIFFQQGNNICFDISENIIIQGYNEKIPIHATCPNGSGGIYKAIHESNVIHDFEKRGLKYIHIHNVDNILVKIANPLFMGYCEVNNLDVGSKICSKEDPNETVGIFCYKNEQPSIIEYYELSDEIRNIRKDNGSLVYNQANIAIYCLSIEFIRKTKDYNLPTHNAFKKIPFWDNKLNKLVKPEKENGFKPEYFIFDAFKYCEKSKMRLLRINRESEFCPIKKNEDILIALNYLNKK